MAVRMLRKQGERGMAAWDFEILVCDFRPLLYFVGYEATPGR